MGPPSHMRYPDIDRVLNKGNDDGLVCDFGTDASCDPRCVSLKLTKACGLVGNLINASKFI